MKKYLAYFDLLGFKDFIENNNIEEQKRGVNNIFRDIEAAMANDNYVDARHGVIADLSKYKIQVANFSDTFLLWTLDDSKESLDEILRVTYDFNWRTTVYNFPARGCMIYGDFFASSFQNENKEGGSYSSRSIFGSGLIDAYLKAESTQWSGAFIDESVIKKIESLGLDHSEYLTKYAKKYHVPLNNGETMLSYAFRLSSGELDESSFKNKSETIKFSFSSYNKTIEHKSVQIKLLNTIEFLKSELGSHR